MRIAIPNGTQLECVHCTACIDACDDIMEKIGKPKGLIRYSSEEAIKKGRQKIITPRVIGYSAVLLILLTTFFSLILTRPATETTILRQPGTLYQELPNDVYSNIFELKAINKTFDTMNYRIELVNPDGEIAMLGDVSTLKPQSSAEGRFLLKLPKENLTGYQTEVRFNIFANGEQIETETANFLGPDELRKTSN